MTKTGNKHGPGTKQRGTTTSRVPNSGYNHQPGQKTMKKPNQTPAGSENDEETEPNTGRVPNTESPSRVPNTESPSRVPLSGVSAWYH